MTGTVSYRRAAFLAFPAMCDICGVSDRRLDVHHRDGDHANDHIDNLQILCRSCHKKTHSLSINSWFGTVSLRSDQREWLDSEALKEQRAKRLARQNRSSIVQEAIDLLRAVREREAV